VKALKKVSSGCIAYNNFTSGGTLTEPFRINANYTLDGGQFIINGGSVVFDAFSFNDCILVVENSYVPINSPDMGGICLTRGTDKKELYEYYQSNDYSQVPYVKLAKHGDIYTGYGSENGNGWSDKGYVYFPNAETIGVSLIGDSAYPIKSLRLYKSETVTIYSVQPGWRADFKNGNSVIASTIATSETIYAVLPIYPFTGNVEIYNEAEELVTVLNGSSGVWGGDEYICAVDVELFTLDNIPLTDDEVSHLGNLQSSVIEKCFKAKNMSNEPVVTTIRVAEYSVFAEWASVSNDYGYAPGQYSNSATLGLEPQGETLFWLKIERPASFNLGDFNYRKEECSFFLEVV
jgi:hypothetical protein